MSQEGQIVRNKRTGEMGIVQNGVVVPYNPQQGGGVFVPDAAAPFEAPKAREEVRGSQLDNQGQGITNTVNAGTARTTIQTNQAPEGTMWRDPNNPSAGVVRIPGYEEKRVTPELRSAALQGFKDAESIAATVEMLRKQYYAGPGSTKGIYGLGDYLPTDANASFDDTGQRARGYVKGALGFTGGEGNTAMEADATYGPYLPTAGDRDGQIANKIAALEALGIKAREKAIATLGGIPDQYGNIQPIPEGERANAMNYLRTDGGANNQTEAAGFNATQKAVPYPEAGQSMHDQLVGRLIAEGDGRLDPQAYAQERMALDRQQGVEPRDAESYAAWAESINTYLGEGGKTIPTGIEPTMQDMSYGETVRNRAASMPEGALFAGYLNSFGMGVPEMMTGANMDMMREENPIPALTGEIGGVIGGTGLLGKLGREGMERAGIDLSDAAMSRFGRNLGTDATYGGIYGGTTEGNPVMGATLGAAGSAGGQALGKTAETAIGGVRLSAPAQALRDRGVRLTSGRIFGDTTSRIEDKMVSLPFAGDMVRRRQGESFMDFNRAGFEEGGKPIGFTTNEVGERGVGEFRQAVGDSYTNATAGKQAPFDNDFLTDMGGVYQRSQRLPQDRQNALGEIIDARIGHLADSGMMTGADYQQAMRALKGNRSKVPGQFDGFEQDYRDAITGTMDAMEGTMRRGGGDDVIAGLDAANAANKNLKILENASLDRAKIGTQTGEAEVFLPSQLIAASRQAENRGFGTSPLKQLGKDGQAVLPSTVPNSGTADRLAMGGLALAGLGGGGAEYMTQQNIDTTATGAGTMAGALALLTALGTRKGQKAIETIALDRPDALKKVAGSLRKNRRLFGASAVPIALSAQ